MYIYTKTERNLKILIKNIEDPKIKLHKLN